MVADILKTVGEAALAEGATEPAIAKLCGEQRPQLRLIKGALGPAPKPEVDIEASYLFKALDDGLKAAEAGDINEGARLINEAARQLKILERTVERVLRAENK